ncbi:MAG: hypothetical protein V4664_00455 [Patescibacteria group bacterium]
MTPQDSEIMSLVESLSRYVLGPKLKSLSYTTSYRKKDTLPADVRGTFYTKNGLAISFEMLVTTAEPEDVECELEFDQRSTVAVVMAQIDGIHTCTYHGGQWT